MLLNLVMGRWVTWTEVACRNVGSHKICPYHVAIYVEQGFWYCPLRSGDSVRRLELYGPLPRSLTATFYQSVQTSQLELEQGYMHDEPLDLLSKGDRIITRSRMRLLQIVERQIDQRMDSTHLWWSLRCRPARPWPRSRHSSCGAGRRASLVVVSGKIRTMSDRNNHVAYRVLFSCDGAECLANQGPTLALPHCFDFGFCFRLRIWLGEVRRLPSINVSYTSFSVQVSNISQHLPSWP